MKKTLLFAILALSINAFAQNKAPTTNLKYAAIKTMKNIHGGMLLAGRKTSVHSSDKTLGQAIKHQTFKQVSTFQRSDSIYYWQWDDVNLVWEIGFKIVNIVYDANNNLTSELGKTWNGTAWVNSSLYTFTYDANNNLTSQLGQDWTGTAWINQFKYNYVYDANNNQTNESDQTWNGSAWVNSYQFTSTYDANNNQTSEIYQSWSGTAWLNLTRYTNTFDANNNLTVELDESWDGTAWKNSSKYTFTYDAGNKMITETDQIWDGSVWANYALYTLTYNANNKLADILSQSWVVSAWVNEQKFIYAYDASNNQTSELTQTWNGTTWDTFISFIYTYDANNALKSNTFKTFDNVGTLLAGDSSYYYFNEVVTGINPFTKAQANINVYPNPGIGMFTLSSSSAINAVEIYNLPGERIYAAFKVNQLSPFKIDISDYAKGIYLIKIHSGTKIYNRKIVVH